MAQVVDSYYVVNFVSTLLASGVVSNIQLIDRQLHEYGGDIWLTKQSA